MKKSKLTKNFQNLCLAILINLIAFTVFVSCENIFIINILPSRDSKTVKYESADAEGNTYILVITGKTSRAAYKGAEGDSYVLTIKQQGQPDKESKGVVTTIKDDGSLTLKPTKADSVPFGVSVSSGKMTAITGTITLDNGTTVLAPGEVTPIGGITFTSVDAMAAWLNARPANTAATAYYVKLNIADLGGGSYDEGSAGYVLKANPTKYVNLDLSGSTMDHIRNGFNCTNLTGITLPASITSYVTWVEDLHYCTNLTMINVDAGNTTLSSLDGVVYNKDKTTLFNYPEGKTGTLKIPNTVKNIEGSAFSGCIGLASITIPDSVTSIGSYAFSGCTGLAAINVDAGNSAYTSENGVLYNKSKTTLYAYPAKKTDSSFTIPDGVTSIGYGAFSGCSGLISVTIPDSVTSIGSSAFYGCTGLASITIPDSVTSIGSSAFYGCTGLASITIPDSVTSIEYRVFEGCTSLTSITIPDGVTTIVERAFYGCTGLASVTIPDSVTSIETNAFYECTGLTSVTIPDSVTSIGSYSFSGCTSLTSVTFQGTIPSRGLNVAAFGSPAGSGYLGDLRDKYLAGGIGTYTTTAPVSSSSVWMKR